MNSSEEVQSSWEKLESVSMSSCVILQMIIDIQLPLATTVLGNRRAKRVCAWMKVFTRPVTLEEEEEFQHGFRKSSIAFHPAPKKTQQQQQQQQKDRIGY